MPTRTASANGDILQRADVGCLPDGPTDLPSYLVSDAPHAALAQAWLDALLDGERHRASRMILDAASSGAQIAAIYQHVFQPALYEIGRLWQMNAISVAQEHYCTAATQLVMSQLYPQIFASEKGAGTLVATCVAGNLHEIGLRMVTDVFEMDGWHTYYLGANMPPHDVVGMVVRRRADVLAISATMTAHLRHVRELIRQVRADPACHDVFILVGGHPFHVALDLWRAVGADGSSPTAQQATVLARRLLADGH
jgi:methanogenic corrinoid protein MtbC1